MIFCVLKKGSGAEEGGEKNSHTEQKTMLLLGYLLFFFGENWNVYKIRGAKKCNCHLYSAAKMQSQVCVTDQGLHFGGKKLFGRVVHKQNGAS